MVVKLIILDKANMTVCHNMDITGLTVFVNLNLNLASMFISQIFDICQ